MSLTPYNKVFIQLPHEEHDNDYELPCIIGIISDLYGNQHLDSKKSLHERNFINLSQYSHFDEVVARLNPKVQVTVKDLFSEKHSKQKRDFHLNIKSMTDLTPAGILACDPLLEIVYSRSRLATGVLNNASAKTLLGEKLKDYFAREYRNSKGNHGSKTKHQFSATIHELIFDEFQTALETVILREAKLAFDRYPSSNDSLGKIEYPTLAADLITHYIATLQRLMEDQIQLIMASSEIRRLEASLLGLKKLFDETKKYNRNENIILKLLPASWKELSEDIQKSEPLEKSALWNKIYGELDMPGGQP